VSHIGALFRLCALVLAGGIEVLGGIERETNVGRAIDDERHLLGTGYWATERIGHVAFGRHFRAGV
jgi:hypothetical protein